MPVKSKILLSVRPAKQGEIELVIHNISIRLSTQKTEQLIEALQHFKSPNKKLSSGSVLASCDEVVLVVNCKAGLK